MRKMEVVVGVDGSDAGRGALREAVRFATSLDWRLTIVAVVPPYEGNMHLLTMGRIMNDLVAPFRDILEQAEAEAAEAGADVHAVLEEGRPWERLVDLAAARGAQLTVLGGGNGFMDRLVTGNTVRRVVGYGQSDVLVVPAGMRFDCSRILNPVDGSPAGFDAADKALDLGRMFAGAVTALHVVEAERNVRAMPELMDDLAVRARACLDEVRARADAVGVPLETLSAEGLATEVITRVAKEREASLIVMSSHGQTGLRRLLMGGVTSKVVKLAPCPVYIARD